MVAFVIALSDAFRAWGVAAALFAWPALWAFLRVARKRAMQDMRHCREQGHRGLRTIRCFVAGGWRAGADTNLQFNAWVVVALMAFLALAGTGIVLASKLSRAGYYDPLLSIAMLPAWALLSGAGWSAAIMTARHRGRCAIAAGILLAVMLTLSLSVPGTAP